MNTLNGPLDLPGNPIYRNPLFQKALAALNREQDNSLLNKDECTIFLSPGRCSTDDDASAYDDLKVYWGFIQHYLRDGVYLNHVSWDGSDKSFNLWSKEPSGYCFTLLETFTE